MREIPLEFAATKNCKVASRAVFVSPTSTDERGGKRTVLNANILGEAGLRAHAAAFVCHHSQFVEAIGLSRGVEGEGEREISGPGRYVKMVARLQVAEILAECLRAVGRNGKRSCDRSLDFRRAESLAARAKIEFDSAGVVLEEILRGKSVGSLQSGGGVNGVHELLHELENGHAAGVIGHADVDNELFVCVTTS